jgi:hypothetical protein
MTATTAFDAHLVPIQRAQTSTVRCGRCGATQTIDRRTAVLTQVRPFVGEHIPCAGRAV